MRNQLALATSTALVLALAACGGSPEETENASAVDEVVTADPAGDASEVDLSEEDMSAGEEGEGAGTDAGEEEDEEPAPTASASATSTPTPSPTPSQVAAAGPPQAFTTCGVCHSVEPGQNMIGPSLAGVVGRRAGSVAGANYSPAMKDADITWTEANLRRYIQDPAAVVPGGTMPNPGVNAQQTQAIINYLKTL